MTEKPAWLKPHGKPWGVSSSKVVYDNPWIRVTEYQAIAPTGRPALYGTTREFLDHFGLKTLADLPALAELRDPAVIGAELHGAAGRD